MQAHHRIRYLLALAFCATVLAHAAAASANSGWVSGYIYLWNKNGNYCPSYADCTGAQYSQSLYDNWQPLRNAKVALRKSDGNYIGIGGTDDYGHYNIPWSYSGSPPNVRIFGYATQKDLRFTMKQMSGSEAWATGSYFSVTNGTTQSSPQQIATLDVGTSSSPNWYFNAYWAAEREWRETFANVGALIDGFTGLLIYGFDSTACPTSCATPNTSPMTIQLDASAGLEPQGRVMHEMGHIANYVLHPFTSGENYCYPVIQNGCGWDPNGAQAEWGAAGFEEAFATYGGNVTFWDPNANIPTTCISTAPCYNATGVPLPLANLEATSYPYQQNGCVTDEGRWPISHMRFHWDVYDSRYDADGDTIQEGLDCFWCPFANLYRYANGTGQYQIDEPWDSSYTYIDAFDGRGSGSWDYNYGQNFRSLGVLRTDNCTSP